MSFLQPLNGVIQKKLIAFPHHSQNFEDSFHIYFTYIFNSVDPILPNFDSAVLQQGVKEEYEWLESTHDDKTSYWVPWAKHHAGKH